MATIQTEMIEAFLAAAVFKLADGSLEIDVDDLLAVEGKTFAINDQDGGFVITVQDDE